MCIRVPPVRGAGKLVLPPGAPAHTQHWGPRLDGKDRSDADLVALLSLNAVGEREICLYTELVIRSSLAISDNFYLVGSRY